MWGINDECLKNPVFMMAECPVTCGACLNVCQDKDRSCQSWALDGQCESNKAAMVNICPQSCGVCHDIEAYYKGVNGLKDEL